ncbi:MAG: hypothetical protein CL610_18875 [Anaerolineaceae bacterium]|nr:hypothetical protein [Anaerolineaceae bacterium]
MAQFNGQPGFSPGGPGKGVGLEAFVLETMGTWTLGLELLLLRKQGARSLPLTRLYAALVMYGLLTGVAHVLSEGGGVDMAAVMLLVAVAFLIRRDQAWDRLRSGEEPVHTHFMGESILDLLAQVTPPEWYFIHDKWTQYRLIHPVLIGVLGLFVYFYLDSPVVAVWMVVGGMVMALKNEVLYQKLIDMVLNNYDSALERYVLPELLKRRTFHAGDAAGVPVSPSLLEVLENIPTGDMAATVNHTMSQTGDALPEQQELPYA